MRKLAFGCHAAPHREHQCLPVPLAQIGQGPKDRQSFNHSVAGHIAVSTHPSTQGAQFDPECFITGRVADTSSR